MNDLSPLAKIVLPLHHFPSSLRYFLSLQLKEDLVNQKLVCSDETYSVLAGYVVQGEFGDYDPLDHTPGYLDDFPFLETRSLSLKTRVEELHQRNRCVGKSASIEEARNVTVKLLTEDCCLLSVIEGF